MTLTFTAPTICEVELDGIALYECPGTPAPRYRCEAEYRFAPIGLDADFAMYPSDLTEAGRWNWSVAGASGHAVASLDEAIDDVVDSIGE